MKSQLVISEVGSGQPYIRVLNILIGVLFDCALLSVRGNRLPTDFVEQLLQQQFRVVKLGFYLFEHGKMLDDLFRKGINSTCEVCEGGEEAGRVVGRFRCLFQPMCSEPAGKAARIIIRRPDSGAALPCRSSCACSGRHCSGGSSGLVARRRDERPQTRSAQGKVAKLDKRIRCDE